MGDYEPATESTTDWYRALGALIRDGQLRETGRYRADGRSGDLNEYLLLQRHDG